MEQELQSLLEYQDILGAVASTIDGLVVASAGFESDDAETVAAAGSAVVSDVGGDDTALAIELDGGSLFLTRGAELMLVVCAEPGIPQDPLAGVMQESIRRLDALLVGSDEFSA
jgi:predicted regulator of Ras-like GTPase activity (Roadblock/LC7/MglB family)